MYIGKVSRYYTQAGEQATRRAWYLMLMESDQSTTREIRAVLRKVALSQLGQFMMGVARVGGISVIVSGPYGGDGLPKRVDYSTYMIGIPLPPEIYDAWAHDRDWQVRDWAKEHFTELAPTGATY